MTTKTKHPHFSKAAFFKAIGYKPHRGQVQIHGAFELPGVKTVLACCGVRFGKSKAAAAEMAYEAVRPRVGTDVNPKAEFMGWIVSFDHASAKVVFGMVFDILKDYLKGHVTKNESEGIITFTTLSGSRGTIMRRTTADAGGKGKLTSYAVDFMVVDEAAKIRQGIDIWENQLSTRLVDRQGRSLHISTPMGVEGYFAEIYRKGQDPKNLDGFVSVQLPTWLNPYIPKEEIARAKRTLREKAFRQEFGAELLADSGMVFDREDIERICRAQFEEPIEDAEYFGGLDLAMTNDYTVLTIARQPLRGEVPQVPRVIGIWRFHRMHIQGQINKIKSICERYNGATLNVDENGIGKSIFEQLVSAGIAVRAVYTTGSGDNSKMNQITHAMTIVEQGRIMLPSLSLIPIFVKELVTYQWEVTPSGRRTANAPEGSNDDCVSSFLLLCWWLPPSDEAAAGQVWHRGMSKVQNVEIKGAKPRPEFRVSGDADPEEVEDVVYSQHVKQERRQGLFGGSGGLGLGGWQRRR